MKTYEDLIKVIDDEKKLGEFCADAVKEFEASADYQQAQVADLYYRNHNVTIENFVKWIYTVSGRRVKDIYSANYKLKSGIFRRGVIQHANYLLGRGVILDNPDDKKKLGKTFDHEVLKAAKMAMVEGRAFGFWNNDHVEAFGYACTSSHAGFRPIYSEDTADMMAGIRFRHKTVNNKKITVYTLYTVDGTIEFTKKDDSITMTAPKTAYKRKTVSTQAEGNIYSEDTNYNGMLPIVPLYASDTYESDLAIIRDKIDCMDLLESGLMDAIDNNAEVYWLIKNAGGMRDPDIAKMLHRLRTVKGVAVDSEDGGGLEPHTIDVPYEARTILLDRLRSDIHEDWMLADRKFLSAAQKTEQEIEMAYQGQDDYTDNLEYNVMEFLDTIFSLAGINSEYHFERNKAGNKTERTNMVLSAANYISPECVIRHLPFLSPEEIDEEINKYQDEQFSAMHQNLDDEQTEEHDENEG